MGITTTVALSYMNVHVNWSAFMYSTTTNLCAQGQYQKNDFFPFLTRLLSFLWKRPHVVLGLLSTVCHSTVSKPPHVLQYKGND